LMPDLSASVDVDPENSSGAVDGARR